MLLVMMAAGVEGIARGGRDWARFAADRLIGKLRKRIAALEEERAATDSAC